MIKALPSLMNKFIAFKQKNAKTTFFTQWNWKPAYSYNL